MKHKNVITTIFSYLFSISLIVAQDDFSDIEQAENITVSGVITNSETGKAIPGANIVVVGTENGTASDEEGSYTIEEVEVGAELLVSAIGYEDLSQFADSGELDFNLIPAVVEMSSLEVLASRAGDKTAVAYTNVTKADIALRLGSQDIPLALNTVPSVYATGQGGGAGDARINVRGFNQRNVAVMINGIPVNDMENGWVYWSNWDGVADATTSIQLQKG